jgi:Holliday junction DNA helicase RuvA
VIGRLTGTVAAIEAERLILDVNGVGYEISMTPKAIASMPPIGELAVVHTHLHVREDGMSLYGFASKADRDLFRILLGASGVGPRVALAMLGVFDSAALRTLVASEDVKALTQVPGIGMRSAQKIVLDLKPKLAALEAEVLGGGSTSAQLRDALEGLGYTTAEIREVLPGVDSDAPIGDQIKSALRDLGRRR